ncbi:MAG: glycosyltransferase [Pelagibacteraceae bacterium TMED247]|nr:MAG: glycosyltransferase [Pelagibacteraceae bacterium TMED247]
MTDKIRILTIGDHPLSPSGVGTQTKYICQALLDSGKFSILSLGGAIKHNDYRQIQVEPYDNEWRIIPIDGYGTPEMIRSVIRTEKIDMVWFMTDPRFWEWLWMMENEIRPLCPMIYYHVWDNFPAPMFNRDFYLSNDHIVTISRVTDDIVKAVAPEVPRTYLPHAVDSAIFKKFNKDELSKVKKALWTDQGLEEDIFTIFWNNRNARRKQSGTLIYWFKSFLDKVGHDKARLLMHTDPGDPHGQDLPAIIESLGLTNKQVMLSTEKLPPEHLSALYNAADCTVNISDAEGFGLSTLESLACGTPIVVNMTGGLQEQINTANGFAGIPLYPVSKAVIGSQQVPYIYEDRLSEKQFVDAMQKMLLLGKDGRAELGNVGMKHVQENYDFSKFKEKWVNLMLDIYESSKNYSNILFKEVA